MRKFSHREQLTESQKDKKQRETRAKNPRRLGLRAESVVELRYMHFRREVCKDCARRQDACFSAPDRRENSPKALIPRHLNGVEGMNDVRSIKRFPW